MGDFCAQSAKSTASFLRILNSFPPFGDYLNYLMSEKEQSKKNQLKFPVSKVKKIIQENQEVGKINNVVPYLLTKSLELFLTDVLTKCKGSLKEKKISKATPGLLKTVLMESQYEFMKDFAQQLPDLEENKKKKKQFSDDENERKRKPPKRVKRQQSEDEDDD